MLAITLYQPWASLISLGEKRFETRSWCPSLRHLGETIAIHAAKRKTEDIPELTRILRLHGLELQDLPTGMVVATACLAGWGLTEKLLKSGVIDAREQIFGDYSPGRWGWELSCITPLATPVPAAGRQSFWEWDGLPVQEQAIQPSLFGARL